MWVVLAIISAVLLGFYDVSKKKAVSGNDILAVLMLNTLFSSILLSPFLVESFVGSGIFSSTPFHTVQGTLRDHLLIVVKSLIVLTSWIFGYVGIKHLPITMVGPIQATRPVMVLLGAMIIFSESLNGYQWIGVVLSVVSLFLLARSGKKEGVDFVRNRYIFYVFMAAFVGAVSGLYDRWLMREQLPPLFVESWYSVYQFAMMAVAVFVIRRSGVSSARFHWSWAIPLISLFLTMADVVYFIALTDDDAMISIVSMMRRGSVVVSFICGALLFHEKNIRSKAFDLFLILLGMFFLYIGSR